MEKNIEDNYVNRLDSTPTTSAAPQELVNVQPVKKQVPKSVKYIVWLMGASIGLAAIVSIVAVLLGGWSDPVWRSLGTILTMTAHAVFAVALLNPPEKDTQTIAQKLLINTILVVIVFNFFISVLSIWQIVDSKLAFDLFNFNFWAAITLFLSIKLITMGLHGGWIKVMSYTTIGIAVFHFLYIQPRIFINLISENTNLPDLYHRGATAIVIAFVASMAILALLSKLQESNKTE